MWNDNQLTKRNTQTGKHEVSIDGVKTIVHIRRPPCEGVKKCSGPNCNYVVSNRQKVNRCAQHKKQNPLKCTGFCMAQMLYIWPANDDGRRWIGVVHGTKHNHAMPAAHNMSTKVKEDIHRVITDDCSRTT